MGRASTIVYLQMRGRQRDRFPRGIAHRTGDENILLLAQRAPYDSLQHAITHFMAHYHTERNHQGLGNRLLQPGPIIAPSQPVRRRRRLGGTLNYYHCAAA